jgi:hypothetical protein
MRAGAALCSAELRHVMSRSDRRCVFFLLLPLKKLDHALDFCRRLPTVAFHSFITRIWSARAVADGNRRYASVDPNDYSILVSTDIEARSITHVSEVIFNLEMSAIPLGECLQRCIGQPTGVQPFSECKASLSARQVERQQRLDDGSRRLEHRGGDSHALIRRHELGALGYRPSTRPYKGLGELEYPLHDRTITVTQCGRICIGRRKINLSQVLAGQNVGIKEIAEKIWLVSFVHYDLGFFDHETGRVECAPNPFGAKLLPMSQEKKWVPIAQLGP